MIQVKEFVDSDHSHATKEANLFLAGLPEGALIDIKYASNFKKLSNGSEHQRSAILVIYRKSE